MNTVIAMAVLAFGAVGLVLVLLLRQISSPGTTLPATAEWIDELSVDRYRPMLRLLDNDDLDFMKTQPGFTPQMTAKLRLQRCQIFRGYLRSLNTDFNRICMAVKILMMQSQHDRPDLASVLLRNQLLFATGMLMVQSRLVLYRWGMAGVDVAGLVKIFDVMRLELRSFVPVGMDA